MPVRTILRIVEVCGQACLTGKQAREGMATVSGMVRASVLYLPETGGCLRHMELSVPFTCQVEAPGLTSQGTILGRSPPAVGGGPGAESQKDPAPGGPGRGDQGLPAL